MRRCQLVELEDLTWFPAVIRDGGTASLRVMERHLGMGRFLAPVLAQALRQTGERQLIDLCSGGAGPLPEVLDGLAQEGLTIQALMTDKYPNQNALQQVVAESGGRADFSLHSVDATNVPENLQGFRTIFNAFHHFPPSLAQGILADAVKKRVPIAVFEVVERTPSAILSILFSPLVAMALMPTIRPRRWEWWLFTYLLPFIPAMLLFDGLVSCFRVYSHQELEILIKQIEGHEQFNWQTQYIRLSPLPLRSSVLIGIPKP